MSNIEVIIPVKNEEINLPFALASVQEWADRVWVIDSESTDKTCEIAKNAEANIVSAKYEILENEAEVRVMGQSIYEDYSKALDNSLKITKIFVIGCLGLFITSLFL